MPKEKRKPIPVMIAVLTQGTVCIQVADILTKMVVECLVEKKYEPTIRFSKQTGVDNNRNVIVQEFLKSDCKFLIMMDDDNPPLTSPLKLIELNKAVMILPTLMYKGDEGKLAFNVFRKIKEGWQTMVYDGKNKLFQVERGGSGCIIIARRVLKKIKAPFLDKKDENGVRYIGEDMCFSDKVWEAGYKMWGHWDHTCSHYKTVDLMGIADLMIKGKQNEDNKTDQEVA